MAESRRRGQPARGPGRGARRAPRARGWVAFDGAGCRRGDAPPFTAAETTAATAAAAADGSTLETPPPPPPVPVDAYGVLVSEVMLQQTRVETVIDYWERWMARFPDARARGRDVPDDVNSMWSGLGYYAAAPRCTRPRVSSSSATAARARARPERCARCPASASTRPRARRPRAASTSPPSKTAARVPLAPAAAGVADARATADVCRARARELADARGGLDDGDGAARDDADEPRAS